MITNIGFGKRGRGFISGLIACVLVSALQGRADVPKEALVKIQLGRKQVCGFMVKMEGKSYILTNTSGISGHDSPSFKTVSGKPLQPLSLELSKTRDIARFRVESPVALEVESSVSEKQEMVIPDYASSGSKVGEFTGTVTHIYEGRFRAESTYAEKNWGSPVLNADGKVCGIASGINFYKQSGPSWGGSMMRTVYQLEGDSWFSPNWKKYNVTYGKSLRDVDDFRNTIYTLAEDWIARPREKVEAPDGVSLEIQRWVKQQNSFANKVASARKKRGGGSNKAVAGSFSENCETLRSICEGKIRKLQFLAEQDSVTPFLSNEFGWRARELKKFVAFIRYHEKHTIEQYWRY